MNETTFIGDNNYGSMLLKSHIPNTDKVAFLRISFWARRFAEQIINAGVIKFCKLDEYHGGNIIFSRFIF